MDQLIAAAGGRTSVDVSDLATIYLCPRTVGLSHSKLGNQLGLSLSISLSSGGAQLTIIIHLQCRGQTWRCRGGADMEYAGAEQMQRCKCKCKGAEEKDMEEQMWRC
jgi:hypothetical protein